MCQRPKLSRPYRSSARAEAWLKRSTAMRAVTVVEAEVAALTSTCNFFQQQSISSRLSDQQETKDDSSKSGEETCNASNAEEAVEGRIRLERKIGLFHRNEIEVGRLLGEGAFSQVHEVTRINLTSPHQFTKEEKEIRSYHTRRVYGARKGVHGKYVIKHLKSDLINHRQKFNQSAADLIIEAKFLSRIDHVNIVTIRGWAVGGTSSFADGRHDGYFMIMDKLDGGTLTQRISQWKQRQQQDQSPCHNLVSYYVERIKCAHEIASALAHLHSLRIVFRDLKPDNVGFQSDETGALTTKIFDFGLCRELPCHGGSNNFDDEDAVYHMSAVGTRRYMAPETVMRTGYNLKVDVYGWAMVFYEMLALERPYDLYNRDVHKILVCQGGQRPSFPPGWPNEIQDLLRRAWSQNLNDRPSMQQITKELQTLIEIAERQMMSPSAKSLNAVYELAGLFTTCKLTGSDLTVKTETMSSLVST